MDENIGDYYLIKSEYHGKVLEVTGSGGSGSQVVVCRRTGKPNQLWKMEPAEDGWFFIISALSPNLVLDVEESCYTSPWGMSHTGGCKVGTCIPGPLGDLPTGIPLPWLKGTAVGVHRLKVFNKKRPTVASQLFRFEDQEYIISRSSGHVLDIEGSSRDDGVGVISWPRNPYTNSSNQRWKLCGRTSWNPEIPYKMSLDGSEQAIHITGTPKPNADRFSVNFMRGSDVLFHFNPRFKEAGGVTVRNSKIKAGIWEKEERSARNFPFIPDQKFQLTIRCCLKGFKVEVNGEELLQFDHRYPPMKMDSVYIDGDLKVESVIRE